MPTVIVISVTQLAQEVSCSQRHLRRLFAQSLGCSPVQMIIERRLNRATQHLLRGMSIGQAAQQVGIHGFSQFSRLFRSRYGCTPSQLPATRRARQTAHLAYPQT